MVKHPVTIHLESEIIQLIDSLRKREFANASRSYVIRYYLLKGLKAEGRLKEISVG